MLKKTVLAAALSMICAGAAAQDQKIWYVYCEGHGHGMHWAVFSQNFWARAATENYDRVASSAAERFFEQRHQVKLTGCSAVHFLDQTSAKYSRDRTVRLHKKMGDRVYFFPLPSGVIPD